MSMLNQEFMIHSHVVLIDYSVFINEHIDLVLFLILIKSISYQKKT